MLCWVTCYNLVGDGLSHVDNLLYFCIIALKCREFTLLHKNELLAIGFAFLKYSFDGLCRILLKANFAGKQVEFSCIFASLFVFSIVLCQQNIQIPGDLNAV